MSRNSVKVCVRTRPTQNFAQDNLFIDVEHASIVVKQTDPEAESTILNNRKNTFKFRFDHVFHNSSQSAVYDLYARDTVHDVVYGINGAILTYGQTGSGKTFTMLGDAASYEHRGMAPRAITQLFQEINSRVELEFLVSCTYMEIYNERIYDLLVDVAHPEAGNDFTIVEEKDGRGIFVRGLTEVEVRDEASALNLLFSGGLSRTMATHKLNKRSNRSHSIFTLYLQQRQRSGVSERIIHSKLHLVDLAGSERLKKTMGSVDGLGTAAEEVTRKESMAINRSLTYLEQCVVALTRKGQTHIPYRQSKLTNILKDCLGANCNTVMIACMWGESTHLEETISTLRLASRMMKVTNESVSVESVDPAVLLRKQEKIIKALKQELLMHDALVERTGMVYDTYTPEQQASIAQLVERFVSAPEKEEEEILAIDTYRQMLEIAKVFKKKLIEARSVASNSTMLQGMNMMMLGGGNNSLDTADSKDVLDNKPGLNATTFNGGNIREVGSAGMNGRGFALGEAKADARPINGIETAANFTYTAPKSPAMSPVPAARRGPGAGGGSDAKGGSPDSRFDSLLMMQSSPTNGGAGSIEAFIKASDEGQALFQAFTQARQRSKDQRSKVRALTQEVNQAKADIDRLVNELEGRKQNRLMNAKKGSGAKGSGSEVIDEEEHRLARDLKDAKMRYRNHFEQLQKIQASSTGGGNNAELEKSKAALVEAWQRWSSTGGKGSSQRWMLDDCLDYHPAASNDFDNNGGGGENDELDDQEAFDKLETERVMANDPDSLAFFSAQKTRRANLTQSGGALKMLQRNKRFT
jgi:kinesin family protein 6/9